MDKLMKIVSHADAAHRRLRFLFATAVVSFRFTSDTTFEDVALALDRVALRHYGTPRAIDVIPATRARASTLNCAAENRISNRHTTYTTPA